MPVLSLLRRLHNNKRTFIETRDEARHFKTHYGQFGEDIVISNLLAEARIGPESIYIDCGAHNPVHISNTLLLHKQGWSGINVDLSEEKIRRFVELRPQDFNVCAALSDSHKDVRVARYEKSVTNRILSGSDVKSLCNESPLEIGEVRSQTLEEIYRRSPFFGRPVGLLNVDCEGHDLEVLKGANLSELRPWLVVVEAFGSAIQETTRRFLEGEGYSFELRVQQSMFFTRSSVSRGDVIGAATHPL